MNQRSSLSKRIEEDRGQLVVRFLEKAVQPLAGRYVLDLGCGEGQISAGLRSAQARVIATDLSVSNLQRVQALESASDPILVCANSALDLPFSTLQFDVVLLNGVLEWVGKAAPDKNPEACQVQVLKEVYRILDKGGSLYLAIENRYYPNWIIHDPHVKLPLLAVLPRRVANFLHRRLRNSPYVTYIHSYRRLRSLLREAGFKDIRFYIPLLHYRWPLKVIPAGDSRLLAAEILALRQQLRNRHGRLSWSQELKFVLYRYTAVLRLSKLLFPSFVVLAKRT